MTGFWLGVIEGFYGQSWRWDERRAYAGFLANAGYQAYLYAPKSDAALRRAWRQPLPANLLDNLAALGEVYRVQGLRWGVGLSPFGFDGGSDDLRLLLDRLRALDALGPDLLCVLFDDMALPPMRLGASQTQAINHALDAGIRAQLLLCPTYYCEDPILDSLFGTRPDNYLEELGQGLPPEVGVFWTGRSVLNDTQLAVDFERISAQLQRKPVLWDNYPVNDGRKTSDFLHLQPFAGRDPKLADVLAAQVVNPMNQPWLSRLPLQSLPGLYRSGSVASLTQCLLQVDAPTRGLLQRDAQRFATQGLSPLDADTRAALLRDYQACDSPWAAEVCAWLSGRYVFDPACLND